MTYFTPSLVVKRITDPFGRLVTFVYDGSTKIRRIQDAGGRVTTFQVDVNGNLIQLTSPPPGVVITRPQLAGHSVVYDIGDVLPQIQSLLPDLKRLFGEPSRSPQSNDGAALLIRYLTNAVPLQSWERPAEPLPAGNPATAVICWPSGRGSWAQGVPQGVPRAPPVRSSRRFARAKLSVKVGADAEPNCCPQADRGDGNRS
jgi:YD repeat-containing protein